MLRPRSWVISASRRAVSRPAMLSRPPVGPLEQADDVEQGALAGARRADQRSELALRRLRSRPCSTSVSTGVPTL